MHHPQGLLMSWKKLWTRRKTEPETPRVDPAAAYTEGMEAWERGELDLAEQRLAEAAEAAPEELKHVGNLGNLYHQRGKLVDALRCHEKAAELAPDLSVAHRNRGRVLAEMGRFLEASKALDQSLMLEPDHAETALLCAQALAESGAKDRASLRCEQSIAEGAASPELHTFYLEMLMACSQLEKAAAAAQLPDIAAKTLQRLGRRQLRSNQPADAAESLSRAAAALPEDHSTLFDLAIAQKNSGDRLASQQSFERATELLPDDPRSRSNLGWLQLQNGQTDQALVSMRQAAALEARTHAPPEELAEVPAHRIHHDAEQFRHILEHGTLSAEAQPYAAAVMALDASLDPGTETVDLTAPEHADIRAGWSLNHHLPDCPALPEGALNPALDLDRLQADYHQSSPEMVVVDDLLRPEALAALQVWCREATIWKRTYDNGYVGAFMRSGLATPLLVQLSEELRTALPRIMKDHRLEQCWAFKCDNTKKGVNLHADVAAVNVNFWIGPDEGNENPEQGGLLVWDVESPPDWAFADYNANQPKMRAFLEGAGAEAIRIPHRCNRALIFNSTLFHETDQIVFRPDYENRRINITLLYGIRLLES